MGTYGGSPAQVRKHKNHLLRSRAACGLATHGDRDPRRAHAPAETRPNRPADGSQVANPPTAPRWRQTRRQTRRRLPGGDRPADRPADGSPVATDPPIDPERKHEKGWGTADGKAERYRQGTRHAETLIGRAGAGGQAQAVPPKPTAPTTTTRGGPGAWRRCASATDPARRNPTTYLT